MKFQIRKIGLTPYSEALHVQENLHEQVAREEADALIFCEHPHVYTFGKSADKNNLLINPEFLNEINAEVFETERGGDITYHGPGQLVGYPIINLRKAGVGVKKYVDTLEESLINTLAQYNIAAYQIPGLTGIWIGTDKEVKRKIGAIGIRVKNGVSMHGFALNINTDLSYFNHIVPCGITDKAVTSVVKEIGPTDMDQFTDLFIAEFENQWNKALALYV
jgi:lipoyl(octanoyl) transferase